MVLENSVCLIDGELAAIQTDTPVSKDQALSADLLGKYFVYQDGQYQLNRNETLHTVARLREELYENGFWCDGVHYVRFKRSSGSSRVGKCLFIDERLYPAMHKYELLGLKLMPGQPVDLAALEAYISLTMSSIMDTIEIPRKVFWWSMTLKACLKTGQLSPVSRITGYTPRPRRFPSPIPSGMASP